MDFQFQSTGTKGVTYTNGRWVYTITSYADPNISMAYKDIISMWAHRGSLPGTTAFKVTSVKVWGVPGREDSIGLKFTPLTSSYMAGTAMMDTGTPMNRARVGLALPEFWFNGENAGDQNFVTLAFDPRTTPLEKEILGVLQVSSVARTF